MSFLRKRNSIRISHLSKKEFCKNSLCPQDYKELVLKNKNSILLKDIIEDWYKGGEIGSDNYMKQSKYRFLKTVNVSDDFLFNENSIEFCKPSKVKKPKNNDVLIVKDGAGSGLGEVALYKNSSKNHDFVSAGLIGVRFKDDKRYYALGFLKSQHFKDYINVNTAQGSTIRHSKLVALDYSIPFPTNKNHVNPNLIENYVSVITQNIIDKEEQIAFKSKRIDEFFEKELKTDTNNIQGYKLPTISKLKLGNRLDTIIYSKKYYEYENRIKSYINGYFFLEEKNVAPGKTPKDYYFSPTKKSDLFYQWVTPKNVVGRRLAYKTYIHTNSKTRINKNTIVLNGIRYVGNGIYIDNNEKIFANQNTLIIKKSNNQLDQLFLYTFLTSEIGKYMQMAQRNFGIVPILYKENLCKIPIPDFEIELKKKITSFYYNPVQQSKITDLNIYLETERKRNIELGIHQLSSEIFELKDKLITVIDKIINEIPVQIDL